MSYYSLTIADHGVFMKAGTNLHENFESLGDLMDLQENSSQKLEKIQNLSP